MTIPGVPSREETGIDMPIGEKSVAELRDYLAEEITLLAWIRAGLALMGFGFVVARFGLFLQEIRITQGGGSVAQPHLFSLWFGTALIVTGVAVNLFSARRHMSLVREWNYGQFLASADDPGVVETLVSALERSGKLLIHASGSSIVADDACGEYASLSCSQRTPTSMGKRVRLAQLA